MAATASIEDNLNTRSRESRRRPRRSRLGRGNNHFTLSSLDETSQTVESVDNDFVEESLTTLSGIGCTVKHLNTSHVPLTCTYTNDYNILKLHNSIVEIIAQRRGQREEEINTELLNLSSQLKKKTKPIEIKPLLAKYKKLKEERAALPELSDLDDYNNEVQPLLAEYDKLGPKRTIVNIDDSNVEEINELDSEHQYRLMIIARFLKIANRYVDLNIYREVTNNDLCPNCNIKLDDEEEDDNGYLSCPVCMIQIPIFYNSSSLTDENIKTVKKGNYYNKETFYDELRCIQGKEDTRLPDNYKQELTEYFINMHNPPIEDIVKQSPLLPDGTREGTSRRMMLKALEAIGMNKYYKNVYKICYEYWGWELWDFDDDFEQQILRDYDISQDAILKVPTNKKSAMNCQYHLHWLLRVNGVDCRPTQFKIPKTDDILDDYERRRKHACAILSKSDKRWKCTWTITTSDL